MARGQGKTKNDQAKSVVKLEARKRKGDKKNEKKDRESSNGVYAGIC